MQTSFDSATSVNTEINTRCFIDIRLSS